MLNSERPERKLRNLLHQPPFWVSHHATFFITINCRQRGIPLLTQNDISQKLLTSISRYHQSGEWFPEIVLLMPDHLHGLFTFTWSEKHGMSAMVKKWKRFTARACGIEWQRDYFDHRIRSKKDHIQKWEYIRENPVRAKLATSYSDWPHVWFPDRIGWK
ncbi:MAG: hypothetical protein QM627_05025 [Luteolibacter sp.]